MAPPLLQWNQPRIFILHPGDYQDLRLRIALHEPCIGNVVSWPESEGFHGAEWVLLGDPSCALGEVDGEPEAMDPDIPWAEAATKLMTAPQAVHLASDTSARPCLHLYTYRPNRTGR